MKGPVEIFGHVGRSVSPFESLTSQEQNRAHVNEHVTLRRLKEDTVHEHTRDYRVYIG